MMQAEMTRTFDEGAKERRLAADEKAAMTVTQNACMISHIFTSLRCKIFDLVSYKFHDVVDIHTLLFYSTVDEMNFQDPSSLTSGIEVQQPKMLMCQLKNYQLKGLNWLVNLYEQVCFGLSDYTYDFTYRNYL